MTHQIIPPQQIESELLRIWDELAKENKMRASLFNLIVFNQLSSRSDYFRKIVQKIIDRFPCRVLFISHDPDSSKDYLKTAVSVIAPEGQSTIACDDIDIGVAGDKWARVPSVILPHIVPDLPVYLLWAEDPTKPHPLFEFLSSLSHRLIFDSESSDNLYDFSKTILSLHKKGFAVADLNWARLEGWRDLLVATFEPQERLQSLQEIEELKIIYNARETEFFCHLKVQSIYLLAYLSARLGWEFKKAKEKKGRLHFHFKKKIEAILEPTNWESLSSGTVIAIEMQTKEEKRYSMARMPQTKHRAAIQIVSKDRCDLPYYFMLGQTASGQSLVREIFQQGTSPFFL